MYMCMSERRRMWKDVLARSKHENEVDIKFSHIEAR